MPIYLPIAFFLAAIIESLLVGTLALWCGCRWMKIPGVGGRRALFVNFAIIGVAIVCQFLTVSLIVLAGYSAKLAGVSTRSVEPILFIVALCGVGVSISAQSVLIAKLLNTRNVKGFSLWLLKTAPVVLFTFGLALIAKKSVVEAFVMPAGSMAPTILGAHANHACTHCGYPFAVSLSERVPPADVPPIEWPTEPLYTACPNCNEPFTVEDDAKMIPGDRFVVDKQVMPQRWEIAVVRYPEAPNVLFAKRLVGLPGETIEIVAGDVFADGKRLQKAPMVAQDLWLDVHDTAFRAKTPRDDEPGWRAGEDSTWLQQQGLWMGGDGEAEADALSYFGPITDFTAYNGERDSHAPTRGDYQVGDVMTACDVVSLSGSGKFSMHWSFRGDAIEAWLAADGRVEMSAESHADEERSRDRVSGKLRKPLQTGDRVAFAIRDGQAYVVHNDHVVLLLTFGSQDVDQAKRDSQAPAQPCRLSLVADRCRVSLSRIVLARDVYYRGGDVDDEDWLGVRGSLDDPVKLGEAEYFGLGDNTQRSKDSRFYGDLQESDLIGTARWIYWPKSRWRAFR